MNSIYKDPYKEIVPSLNRVGIQHRYPAIYTGNPSKGGGRRGWVEIQQERKDEHEFYPPETNKSARSDVPIQILISAFRDGELCGETLKNIFTKAAYPDRIEVSIVEQNDPLQDIACFDAFCMVHHECKFRRQQVRIYSLNASSAKGPVFARALQSRMVKETSYFCMQIDSHMDFADSFDLHLTRFWRDTKNEYAVISTYVADLHQLNKNLNSVFEVPHLCQITKSIGNIPRNGQAKAARMLNRPQLTTLWAAGLSFARCHFEKRVPYDPNLPFVFDGEEIMRTVRGYTWGYDFYTPPRTVVGHNYHRQRRGHWKMTDANGGIGKSIRRMQNLLNIPISDAYGDNSNIITARAIGVKQVQQSRYGLGKRRSLEQFQQWSRIETGKAHSPAVQGQCTNYTWTSWKKPSDTSRTESPAAHDELWNIDALSWPPPLEGALTHLDWSHDPANPKALQFVESSSLSKTTDNLRLLRNQIQRIKNTSRDSIRVNQSSISSNPATELVLLSDKATIAIWSLFAIVLFINIAVVMRMIFPMIGASRYFFTYMDSFVSWMRSGRILLFKDKYKRSEELKAI